MSARRRRAGFPFMGVVCIVAGVWATLEPIGRRKLGGPIAIALGLYLLFDWLLSRPSADEE